MRQFTNLLLVMLLLSSSMLYSQRNSAGLTGNDLDKLKLELMNTDLTVETWNGITPVADPNMQESKANFATSNPSRAELWNNGPMITHPTGGFGGNAASVLQSASGPLLSIYGFGAQQTAGNSMADDFLVTGTWTLNTMKFYAYQTGSSTTSTITGIYVQIWNGAPNAGGTVVWGDLTTNRLASTTWSSIYRSIETDFLASNRPIMEVSANVAGCVLNSGTYWVQYTFTGSLASGPWAPPITIWGQGNTGNALQLTSTGWAAAVSGTAPNTFPQGVPFIIEGTAGGQPNNDLGVTSILAPSSGVNLGSAEPVTIRIQNFGLAAQSNFPVSYTINGGTPVTATVAATINAGATYDYTFTTTANLSAYGTYAFQACANLAGDQNPANNCATKSVVNAEPSLCVANLYSSGCSFGDGLTSWSLQNITVANIPCSGTPPWYQNYMNQIHNLEAGNTYVLTVTAGYADTWVDVWIDFDGNLVLNNTNELVLNDAICLVAATPYTFNITIPANAPSGTFVLRARTNWTAAVTDPCATYAYGNCVDFKANIGGGGTGGPPPTNLVGQYVAPNSALLTWVAPVDPGTWIQWCSNTNNDGIGLTEGGTFIVAARWVAADLTAYNGKPLTKVAIFPRSTLGATFTLKIYKGANAGTMLVNMPLTGLTQNAWNEITLTNPVAVDASTELWVGYQVTHVTSDYPAGCDAGPAIANKGDMISLDAGATWSPLSGFGLDYNWNIKAFVADQTDATFAEPIAQSNTYNNNGAQLGIGNLKPVENSTFNIMRAPDSYKVFRDGNQIAQGITALTYTDSGLIPGTYVYTVKATYPGGDSDPSNPVTVVIPPQGQAGISFNPTALTEAHALGGFITTKTLNVTNTGTIPLNFSITINRAAEAGNYGVIDPEVGKFVLPVGSDRANPTTPTTTATMVIEPGKLEPVRSFTEGFNDITLLPGLGWATANNSSPAGTLTWFQGNETVFPAYQGGPTSYLGVNYNSGGGTATISNWMMTPETTFNNGDSFSFWTRTVAGSTWPDRLEFRLSTAGSSTNVGTTATSVGDFTTLLLSVNPNLTAGGYPEVWTQFTGTITGLSGATSGRMAFRYFVTNGGPSGANSNYIGIDSFEFTSSGGPADPWLSAAPIIGTVPAGQTFPVIVTFNSNGLAAGTYNGGLVFTSNAPGSPHTVPATLTVGDAPPVPVMSLNPTSLFETHLTPPQITTKTVTVTNSGTGTLNWDLTINRSSTAGPDVVLDPEYVAQQYAHRQAAEGVIISAAKGLPGGASPNMTDDEIIRYDNGTNSDAIGLTAGGTFHVSAYWPASTMGQYSGMKLDAVEIFVYDAPTSMTLKIYGQGTSTVAGPLLHSQPISAVAQTWVMTDLTSQVDITGQDIWIGYEVTHTGGTYCAGVDPGPAVAGFGDMISLSGGTYESMSISYGLNYNWNIAGYLVPGGPALTKDVGVQTIISPNSGVALGTVSVVIKVKNFGTAAQSNIPWSVSWTGAGSGTLSGTIPGPLAGGADIDVTAGTANLTAFGTYNFEACTSLSGDENPANNCKTKAVVNNEPSLCVNNLYTSGCSFGDGLTSWSLQNITVANIPCSGTPPWYQNYMNQIHELEAGNTYVLTVTAGYNDTWFDVWVDFDGNLVLNNANELVLNDAICLAAGTPYTFNITIPADAPNGTFVMRARTNWLAAVTDPCATYSYGNCVDFKAEIGGGGPSDPWLSALPLSGSLGAGQSQVVTVTFNSASLANPSVNNGSLVFASNAAGSPHTVPATLVVGGGGLVVTPSNLEETHDAPPQITTKTLVATNTGTTPITYTIDINTTPTAGPDAVIDPAYVALKYVERFGASGIYQGGMAAETCNGILPVADPNMQESKANFATSNPNRAELWNNGPLITHPTGGFGGNAASVLQSGSGPMLSTYGFGAQQTAGNSMADDFTVDATWNLNMIKFYSYQTGSSTASTITGVYVQIWNGAPNAGGTVVWGDLTTNRLSFTTWSAIYRSIETNFLDATRPIMEVEADVTGCVLNAGTYWVQYQFTGSLASGPWAPPISIWGQGNTGNALQLTSTGWAAAVSGTAPNTFPQGMPFIIEGTSGGQANNDLGVTNILTPNSGVNLGSAEPVTIRIKNFGLSAQSNFPVSYTINGGTPVTATVAATINAGATYDYTFTTTANLSAYGNYAFQACANLTGDENPANNCANKNVVNSAPSLCVDNLYSSGCSFGDGLTSWSLQNITVANIPCSGTPPWYQNYMDQIHQLEAGNTYVLTVTAGYADTYFDVWIDFDNNLVLNNTNELVLNDGICAVAGTVYTFNITIPANAPGGTYVMRARTNWTAAVTDPCATYAYGNCVDFKAQIGGAPPTAWLTASPLAGTIAPGQSQIITVTFNSTGLAQGDYNGSIVFNSNASNPVVTVPVVLHVISDCPLPEPTNLTLQQTGNNPYNVILNWTAPTQPGGVIRWDSGVNNGNAIGLTAGGTFSVAAKFNPDQLTQYNGLYLTAIDLFSNDPAATFVIKVWVGPTGTQLVLSQPATVTSGQWSTVSLNTPVLINAAQALYIGYETTHGAGTFPAGTDDGPAVANFGDLISLSGGAWTSMSVAYGLNYNWNLAGHIGLAANGLPLAQPIEIGNITAPAYGVPVLGQLPKPVNGQWTNNVRALEGYDIMRDNVIIATVGPTVTTYTNINVPVGPHVWKVGAHYTECTSWSLPASYNVFVVEKGLENTLTIYPNPAYDVVNIESTNIKQVMIINNLGQVVYNKPVDNDNVQINTSNFGKGVYIVRIQTDSKSYTEKLIIQ